MGVKACIFMDMDIDMDMNISESSTFMLAIYVYIFEVCLLATCHVYSAFFFFDPASLCVRSDLSIWQVWYLHNVNK